MAITYKLFLDERTVKSNNRFALKLRITYNRKHKVIPLNIELSKEDWNPQTQKVKVSHPNAKLINIKINQALNDVQEKALKYETVEKVYDVQDLSSSSNGGTSAIITFQKFAENEIECLIKAGRVGNAITYRTATNKLMGFSKSKELRFEQIDYKLLDAFTNSMLAQGMTKNAIASYMREIRAIYNKAIKAEIVDQKYYPFNKYKIRTTKTISRALTSEEMQKISSLELPGNSPIWHARNYFLLSFYLIGINFTDMFLLKPENIVDSRIVFSRSKTKKIYSIQVHKEAHDLLAIYYKPENKPRYLFPIITYGDSPTKVKKDIQQAIKTTNKYLSRIAKDCSIGKEVTTYYARYSWANIAKALGYSKDLIAEALGHEYGNRVTGIYLDNYGNEVIDKANQEIVNIIGKK